MPVPHTKYQIQRTSAFTLIELLVVISIIGFLAALSLVAYAAVQKQSRDVARKSDLTQYRNILETYLNQNGLYPVNTGSVDPTAFCNSSSPNFINITGCPSDPKQTSQTYGYCTDNGGTQYDLWASMENTSNYWMLCSNGKSGFVNTVPTCGTNFSCLLP